MSMRYKHLIKLAVVLLTVICLVESGRRRQNRTERQNRKNRRQKNKGSCPPKSDDRYGFGNRPVQCCINGEFLRHLNDEFLRPLNSEFLRSLNGGSLTGRMYLASLVSKGSAVSLRFCPEMSQFYVSRSGSSCRCIRFSRMVLATEVSPNDRRWMVYIHPGRDSLADITVAHCGGSILSPRHILTAAHCVVIYVYYESGKKKFRTHNSITIRSGRHDLLKDETDKEQIRIVGKSNMIVHPEYDSATLNNDIAILMFDEPLLFNDWTNAVALPEFEISHIEDKLCRVTGWGKTEFASFSNVLLEAKIKKRRCKLPEDLIGRVNPTTMFCAHKLGRDSCKGDSGGPYICKSEKWENRIDGKWVQYGIVSWGPHLSCGNFSGIYVNVANYIDWIKETMNLPLPGKWGRWSGYSACSVTCRKGIRIRVRLCDSPQPINSTECGMFVGEKYVDPVTNVIVDFERSRCKMGRC